MSFDDEDTQPFTRSFMQDEEELGLENVDDWYWSDADEAEALALDIMP